MTTLTKMDPDLKRKLQNSLPNSPGVYFHKNINGEVIYVGKASNLNNRVRQYFQKSNQNRKTVALIEDIKETEWITTDSEIDALFLESEMIKRYMPRYNILLRDDKTSAYVRINTKSDLPTVTITRIPLGDNAEYIGPFYSLSGIKKALRYLRKIFPYYTKASDQKSALLKQLNLVPTGSIKEYRHNLNILTRYLRGDYIKVQKDIEKDMLKASKAQNFELAAKFRNQLFSLNELKRQIVFSDEEFTNISKDRALTSAKRLFLLDKEPIRIECYDISHHGGFNTAGSMVVFTNGVADKKQYRHFKLSYNNKDDTYNMAEVLSRRFSGRHKNWPLPSLIILDGAAPQLGILSNIKIDIPVIGLAKQNDQIIVSKKYSNINLKNIERLQKTPPDGITVNLESDSYIINLHAGATHSSSHSFTFLGSTKLHEYTDLLKLIQRLRDESHRFAINYHKKLKVSNQTKNILEQIDGIGPKSRQKLIKAFGDVGKIAHTPTSEIAKLVGTKKAVTIRQYLSQYNKN